MATMKSHISWTDSTWNPTTGCTKVSAGCQFCYAEALTNRLWGGGFDTVKLHAKRIPQIASFAPVRTGDSTWRPRMVFVNSMSDLMHDEIPDSFRDRVFDAIETMPFTVFQVLTKRAMTLRRYADMRWKGKGVPRNVWLGASVEDNRVKGRIDILRRLKESVGPFTAFLSVEPLIGPSDQHDYTGIEWVLIGGESGNNARPMAIEWARTSRDQGRATGSAIWFKQWGRWQNNPLYAESNATTHMERVQSAIARGELFAKIGQNKNTGARYIEGEKGGATLDGVGHRDLPPAYNAIALELAAAIASGTVKGGSARAAPAVNLL